MTPTKEENITIIGFNGYYNEVIHFLDSKNVNYEPASLNRQGWTRVEVKKMVMDAFDAGCEMGNGYENAEDYFQKVCK